ncbi:M4 family metallopeptidase [Actinosynnema sp. NPDC047251]|uniref:Zinc metalloprotease (Elastase)-like protein n=1 Tax=Saccharothrix espanaensis (strain ATCC 51144 / DSM 44229 / JCM 9112 / NBRC 15066 / NRRL 15764) TaxID=1179773 RepID=K0K0Q2_SACES|nr:M4 family metallopeptidase [Saccharothrix espanaensis]CCH30113.1 Zinc metalloprotease (elastase)-like protein [Saccharothrix espanaensis DSM 44229]
MRKSLAGAAVLAALAATVLPGGPAAHADDLTLARAATGGVELAPLSTTDSGDRSTVRFGQRHRGVPVFGAQTLVHLAGPAAERTVRATTDRTARGLTVDTTPTVSEDRAVGGALAALDPQTRSRAKTERHGLVVLPNGPGVLTWHLTVRGEDVPKGQPMRREVYVDAHTGAVALEYDNLHFAEGPATGEGVAANGKTKPLAVYERADGRFELRDRSRAMFPATGGEILTYDAEKRDYYDFLGEFPPETKLFAADTTRFDGAAAETGGVDAHWSAGQVYEFYRQRLGREGIDGKGGSSVSVAGVTNRGRPFLNAFWDGRKMVYGWATGERLPLSADLDVVGHEMTHGITEHTAGLVYLGQSGAINEAVSDYLGNAIDVTVTGTPMTDPNAGLLGEDLCRTTAPEECAIRDLNDGRTTVHDYLGVTNNTDNGGVHLNSTIFGGALWDIRERLDPALADKVVYTALTEYLTPLDTFVDGRTAVLGAAAALKLTARQQATIARAFDDHGIVPGWEQRLGTDSTTLVPGVTSVSPFPSAANGRYVVLLSDPRGEQAAEVFAGRTDRATPPVRLSAKDGTSNAQTNTDGTTAVWSNRSRAGSRILARTLDGGPLRTVVDGGTDAELSVPVVSGDVVAWQHFDFAGAFETDVWVRVGDGPARNLTPEPGVQGNRPFLRGHLLSYTQVRRDGTGWYYNAVVENLRTGTRTVVPSPTGSVFVKDVVLTASGVAWIQDVGIDGRSGVLAADHDGRRVRAVVAEDGEHAPMYPALDASDQWLTFSTRVGAAGTNAGLPKLVQVPVRGGTPERVSCNRGDQASFAADRNRRVVWLDGTAGGTDLVTREAPARRGC